MDHRHYTGGRWFPWWRVEREGEIYGEGDDFAEMELGFFVGDLVDHVADLDGEVEEGEVACVSFLGGVVVQGELGHVLSFAVFCGDLVVRRAASTVQGLSSTLVCS